MMALGVLKYLENYSIKNVTVVSFNGIDEMKSLINNGQLYSTVDVNAEKQGFEGVRKAVSMVNDGKNANDQLVEYSFTKKINFDENND
jgi:ABC-type sugar transport system substrate-binding protein